MEAKRICIPEYDSENRFVLAKEGINNLLVICLNPSTADATTDDGTTRNIDQIASVNGFDGWLLFNLSPERTSRPEELSVEPYKPDHEMNINLLEGYFLANQLKINNVLLAWGNNITALLDLPYLRENAVHILNILKKYRLDYWCIKHTHKGHPFHPASQGLNRYVGPVGDIILKPFDVQSYLKVLTKDS
ncbi:DUF1643 domain-containing protein [Mangrovimonas sp. YM274]|uniref:DUF1643 domain-containing protein n=1 Tax=Mangrovimonas sp. YM274 TaxID=3070660 RepID=UPI0027DD88D2|nr:DUF1643 domain-containing protein [Mangrovimonas sp. YM274]WMI70074.1 DUF1643 domain-containing protein [Mangrovimonas sp. YM274]